jgi:hypothetical protein
MTRWAMTPRVVDTEAATGCCRGTGIKTVARLLEA